MAELDGPVTLEIAGQTVVIAHDREADVWYVQGSTVPGLFAEAATPSELADALQVAVRAMSMP